MNPERDLDRIVTDWLRTDVPARAPQGVLVVALERAADVRQDRRFRTRGFGAWIGPAPLVHRALALAVVAAALIGLVAGVGAVLRRSPAPMPAVTNGAVLFISGPVTRQSPSDLYLAGDGSDELLVDGTSNGLRIDCPAFSPDGTRLAYSERPVGTIGTGDGHGTVIIEDIDGAGRPSGSAMHITVSASNGICPTWSPDGTRVAWIANGLWLSRPDGTVERVTAWDAVGDAFDLDWSPDGTSVVTEGTESTTIWIVPVDGGPARALARTDATSDFAEARWSPDGTDIAVIRSTFEENAEGGRTSTGSAIELYAVDGSRAPTVLLAGANIAWSPDGRRLAYVRSAGRGQNEIVLIDTHTSETRIIAPDAFFGEIGGLEWSPDGKQLVFVRAWESLWTVPSDGDGVPERITQPHALEYTGSQQITWQPVRR
jgi:Tol biopolymer transport system component